MHIYSASQHNPPRESETSPVVSNNKHTQKQLRSSTQSQ